jgi:pimeloyl-ACP methyl ester carboxylesterase
VTRLLRRAALALALCAPPLAAQAPAAGRTVRVNGAELHYREWGSGEPLLLLHGFGGCANEWDAFAPKLAERYRVIAMDLRGHGRSTNPSRTFTMRQSGADVLALLDSLRLPRVRAIGISAGAMTLLHVATRQPSRVAALVLVGGTTAFGDEARAVMRTATREQLPPEVLADFGRCATRGDAQVDELLAQFRAFEGMRDDPNFGPADLARVTAPTLIVHGDRDIFFPVDIPVGMYRHLPESQLWIVPNGDHVPIHDPLVPFTEVALRFLQRAAAKP